MPDASGAWVSGGGEPSYTQVCWELMAQVSGELYLLEPQMEVPLDIVLRILQEPRYT